MSNLQALHNISDLASLLPDGVWPAVRALINELPPEIKRADNLGLFAFAALSTTKQEVSDTANSRPLIMIVRSNGTAAWLHVYNNDADDVTVGVNVDFVVPVAGTTGEVSVVLAAGASWARFWTGGTNGGLTVSASTATETSSAPANPPDVWIVYTTS